MKEIIEQKLQEILEAGYEVRFHDKKTIFIGNKRFSVSAFSKSGLHHNCFGNSPLLALEQLHKHIFSPKPLTNNE